MKLGHAPEDAINWPEVPVSVQSGGSGTAAARTCEWGEIRLRLVDDTPGYIGDSWCCSYQVVEKTLGDVILSAAKNLFSTRDSRCFAQFTLSTRADPSLRSG